MLGFYMLILRESRGGGWSHYGERERKKERLEREQGPVQPL